MVHFSTGAYASVSRNRPLNSDSSDIGNATDLSARPIGIVSFMDSHRSNISLSASNMTLRSSPSCLTGLNTDTPLTPTRSVAIQNLSVSPPGQPNETRSTINIASDQNLPASTLKRQNIINIQPRKRQRSELTATLNQSSSPSERLRKALLDGNLLESKMLLMSKSIQLDAEIVSQIVSRKHCPTIQLLHDNVDKLFANHIPGDDLIDAIKIHPNETRKMIKSIEDAAAKNDHLVLSYWFDCSRMNRLDRSLAASTALLGASRQGNYQTLKMAIAFHPVTTESMGAALRTAAETANYEVIKRLLGHAYSNRNLEIKSAVCDSLKITAAAENFQLTELLVKIIIFLGDSRIPLIEGLSAGIPAAARHKNTQILKYLLETVKKNNLTVDESINRAIPIAASASSIEALELLTQETSDKVSIKEGLCQAIENCSNAEDSNILEYLVKFSHLISPNQLASSFARGITSSASFGRISHMTAYLQLIKILSNKIDDVDMEISEENSNTSRKSDDVICQNESESDGSRDVETSSTGSSIGSDSIGDEILTISEDSHQEIAQFQIEVQAGSISKANLSNITRTALLQSIEKAALGGHLDVIKKVIEELGNDPELPNILGASISSAATNGHYGIVKLLVAKQRRHHSTHQGIYDALTVAATNGHLNVLQYLVKLARTSQIYIGTCIQEGLPRAAKNEHLRIVNYLINIGRNDSLTEELSIALPKALRKSAPSGNLMIARSIIKSMDIDRNSRAISTSTVLAARAGHINLCLMLFGVAEKAFGRAAYPILGESIRAAESHGSTVVALYHRATGIIPRIDVKDKLSRSIAKMMESDSEYEAIQSLVNMNVPVRTLAASFKDGIRGASEASNWMILSYIIKWNKLSIHEIIRCIQKVPDARVRYKTFSHLKRDNTLTKFSRIHLAVACLKESATMGALEESNRLLEWINKASTESEITNPISENILLNWNIHEKCVDILFGNVTTATLLNAHGKAAQGIGLYSWGTLDTALSKRRLSDCDRARFEVNRKIQAPFNVLMPEALQRLTNWNSERIKNAMRPVSSESKDKDFCTLKPNIDTNCTICLCPRGTPASDNAVVVLKCKSRLCFFHKECILQHFESNSFCPNCRTDF